MLWKCYKNIVDVAFFFFLIPLQISATIILFYFFPPIFGNAIVTIAIKKKNWFPYFGNGIATIRFSQFFFLPIFDNAIATIVTKKKISPYFGNGIATISLSIFFFFFSLRALHAHWQQNWAQEIRYPCCRNSTFSLSTFFFFSLILLVEFQQW